MFRSLLLMAVVVFGLAGCKHTSCCYSPSVSKYPSGQCCPQGAAVIANAPPASFGPGCSTYRP